MTTATSFSAETVAEALGVIESGAGHPAAITQFRVKWNLSELDSERLYRLALSRTAAGARETVKDDGTRDILWGLGAFLVGGVITAVTWMLADPGGSYFLFWGPMLFGGYRLVKGFTLKFRNSPDQQGAFMWLAVAVVLGGVIVGAGTLAYASGSVDPPPDNDFIWVEHTPEQVGPSTVRFGGELANLNDTWSVRNVQLTLTLFDARDTPVGEYSANLDVGEIGPFQTTTYMQDFTLTQQFDSYQPAVDWEWTVE